MSEEEKDDVFKINVPIITNEELKELDYIIENDIDNIIHQISRTISRDREIIFFKKIIDKLQKENAKLKLEIKNKSIIDLEEYSKLDTISVLGKEYISKDIIRNKIKELEKELLEYKDSQEWEIQLEIELQIEVLKELLGE